MISVSITVRAMDWSDWIAAGALLASLAAFGVSLRSQRAARRSSDAAERSAGAAERELALMEEQASRYEVPWQVSHSSGDTYLLTNGSDEPAYDVEVTTKMIARGPLTFPEVGPRAAVSFMAVASLTTGDSR